MELYQHFAVGFGEVLLKPTATNKVRLQMLVKGRHRIVLELSVEDAHDLGEALIRWSRENAAN